MLKQFYLHDWFVDAESNRLMRGDVELRIEAKIMAVLVYLAEHQGEVISREELEEAIWGNTVVGYDALTRCIARLRKELGDDSRNPQYIETIAKKGYRLLAPVQGKPADLEAGSLTATRLSPKVLLLVMVVMSIAALLLVQFNNTDSVAPITRISEQRPAIVVLPFRNLGSDPRQQYFSDGISADVTTALSKLSGLFVIAPSSAEAFRDINNRKQVADALGVRYVLEGSIRRTEDRIRMNVNLIDTQRDIYIWSEKYDRQLQDVFAVQDAIAGSIANALSVTLTEDEKRRTAERYTTSIEAYDDFLKGQALYFRHNPDKNLQAREYYQRAIDRDKNFARAYSATAMTYALAYRYGWYGDRNIQLEKALALANKALDMNEDLPHVHWVLSYIYLFRQDYKLAATAAQRAIALDENFADSYVTLAVCSLHFSQPEEAIRLIRKAMLLNPQYPTAYDSVLGQAYYFSGDYEQAVITLRRALERNISLLTAHVYLIASLTRQNLIEDAAWAAEQLKTQAPEFKVQDVSDMLPVRDAQTIEDIKTQLQRAGL